jgi:hypothetical protein
VDEVHRPVIISWITMVAAPFRANSQFLNRREVEWVYLESVSNCVTSVLLLFRRHLPQIPSVEQKDNLRCKYCGVENKTTLAVRQQILKKKQPN